MIKFNHSFNFSLIEFYTSSFVHTSYATFGRLSGIQWNIYLVFSQYTHKPLGECVDQESTRGSWDIPWYTTRERCITILYHAIGRAVTKTINAKFALRKMGKLDVITSKTQRLSCFLIGCIFYGMV